MIRKFLILIYHLTLFWGLCHVAPSSSFGDVFPVGIERTYIIGNDVSFGDLRDPASTSAYKISGSVKVGAVWAQDDSKLLRLEIIAPKLSFKSKPSKSTTFLEKSSSIDRLANRPFYALWSNGKISKTYFKSDETDSTALNFQKGILSLFQYQLLDGTYNENDVSGNCDVQYTSKSSTKYVKTKTKCNTLDVNYHQRVEAPLGVAITPTRSSEYAVNEDGVIERVENHEYIKLSVNAFPKTGAFVESRLELKFDGFSTTIPTLVGETLDAVVTSLPDFKEQLTSSTYETKCVDEECLNLIKFVKNYKDALKDKFVGSHSSAHGLLKLIPIARRTKSEEFVRILNAKSTKSMQNHLYDMLGAVQTTESHAAAVKLLNLTLDDTLELNERYLQAVAISTRPNPAVILELLKMLESPGVENKKLKQTFVLTIASAMKKYAELPGNSYGSKVVEKVEAYILGSLEKCDKDEGCKLMYIRGLQNLKSPNTVTLLQSYAVDGTATISVAAMKALRTYRPDLWTSDDKQELKAIFFQRRKKYDTSARAIALDMLLESKLSDDDDLTEMVQFLKSNDKAFEVKQYLYQKLKMKAQSNSLFKTKFENIVKGDKSLNNYNILGVRGLTTALARVFSTTPSFNATLISIQEINSGLLKQGLVDLVMHTNNEKFSMLSVGLYAAGLSSFVGDSSEEDTEDDETATAGMEIGVQEISLRSLEFFNGKTELFGHVWSGTASESTPAYQGVTVLQDHQEILRLQNGAVVDFSLLGAMSIDLNGQVQISLWNKNAKSQVVKNIGIALNGKIVLDASFIQLRSEFSITEEPQLELATDIDFSSAISLCVRPNQPEKVTSHRQITSEIITQGGVNNRFMKNYSYRIAGYSYLLNQKNNEMCNNIFSS